MRRISSLRIPWENDSKEDAPTPGSSALIEFASQVIGVEQADRPANFGL